MAGLNNQVTYNAADMLTHAISSNIIPNQEFLLQGSCLDNSVEHLLHRLKGLCDNVDSGMSLKLTIE